MLNIVCMFIELNAVSPAVSSEKSGHYRKLLELRGLFSTPEEGHASNWHPEIKYAASQC